RHSMTAEGPFDLKTTLQVLGQGGVARNDSAEIDYVLDPDSFGGACKIVSAHEVEVTEATLGETRAWLHGVNKVKSGLASFEGALQVQHVEEVALTPLHAVIGLLVGGG